MISALLFVVATTATPVTTDALFPLVGEHVRVTDRAGTIADDGMRRPVTIVGNLAQYDGETLVITRDGKRWTVPRTQVDRVQVSVGRRSLIGKGARTGAVAGGSIGLLLGLACVGGCEMEGAGIEWVGLSTVALGAIGAAAGAILAAPFSGTRWDEVRLSGRSVRMSPILVPHGLGAALTVGWPARAGDRPQSTEVRR